MDRYVYIYTYQGEGAAAPDEAAPPLYPARSRHLYFFFCFFITLKPRVG